VNFCAIRDEHSRRALHPIAVVGDPRHVGAEIVRRFSGLVDRFTLYTLYPLDHEVRADLVEALHCAI